METNNVSPEKKSSILNSLAIAGFVGIVLLLAWLAIQLVQLFPNAVTSLASLAEGVDQASETMVDDEGPAPIVVTSNTSLIKTGETLTVNWDQVEQQGSYTFAYDCTDGVAVAQTENGTVRQLDCGTNYNVGNVTNLALAIESEKNRYTDVSYDISFLGTDDVAPVAAGTDVVTVINEDINGFAFNDTTNDLATEEVVEPISEPVAETPVAEPETPTSVDPAPVTPTEPVFEQEFVYEIPTSDPDGVTDLATSFIATGEVINNQFVPGPVAQDNAGAIQFSVKNFGTKTSDDWTFTVSLPSGGEYNSPTQEPLKPNERAVLTIGFPAAGQAAHTFEVEVDESTDRNSGNDSFAQRVTFAN